MATIIRRPRYALLTVPSLALTCWFAESYFNAEIGRYFLGPALIVVTWLAILAGEVVGLLERLAERGPARLGPVGAGRPGRRRGPRPGQRDPRGRSWSAVLLVPGIGAIAGPGGAVDRSGDRTASRLAGRRCCPSSIRTASSSAGGATRPRYGTHRTSRAGIPDVWIVDDRTRLDEDLGSVADVIDANLGKRPVYLIRLPDDVATLEASYALDPDRCDRARPAGLRVTGRIGGAAVTAAVPAPAASLDTPPPAPAPPGASSRTSSRPTTRRRNLEALVAEALAPCRRSPTRFEIIVVDDGSRDATAGPRRRARRRASRASSGSSTTRRTWATARRSARASGRPASTSSASPTATASSRSPTSAG